MCFGHLFWYHTYDHPEERKIGDHLRRIVSRCSSDCNFLSSCCRSPVASSPSRMHCFISLEGLEISSFPRSHILVEACLRIHLLGTLLITSQDKKLHHITVEACPPILCILSDLILVWVLLMWQIIDHLAHLFLIQWNTWALIGCPTRMVVNKEVLVLLLSSHHQEPGLLRLVHGECCLT